MQISLDMSSGKRANVIGGMKHKYFNILVQREIELLRELECCVSVRQLCDSLLLQEFRINSTVQHDFYTNYIEYSFKTQFYVNTGN